MPSPPPSRAVVLATVFVGFAGKADLRVNRHGERVTLSCERRLAARRVRARKESWIWASFKPRVVGQTHDLHR